MFMWYPCLLSVISREPWKPTGNLRQLFHYNPFGPFVVWSLYHTNIYNTIGVMISFLIDHH